jgi:hypothetical protein
MNLAADNLALSSGVLSHACIDKAFTMARKAQTG